MKNILLLIFILGSASIHAQNFSGTVTYDVDFMFSFVDTSKVAGSAAKSYIVKVMNKKRKALAGDRPMYRLDFNQHEAIYKAIPIMTNDANKGYKQDKSVFYINTETGEKYKKINLNGKEHRIVKNKKQYDWKISKESKEIQGYTCYRATKKLKRPGKIITITAWFAPVIPLHYGPRGFNGLPGIILGLEELGIYYEALDVKLKNKDKKIMAPKGELITEEELIGELNAKTGMDLGE